jgi:hypothetical protein
MTDDLVQRLRADVFYGDARLANMDKHNPLHMDAADRIEQLEREKAVVSDLWEQQKEIALDYLADCNKAAHLIEAQAAEIEHLRAEAKAHYDRGYYDGSTHPIVRHDALRQSQPDVLKIARDAINGLLDIAPEENLDSEQAGRAYAALHEIGTALAALGQSK